MAETRIAKLFKNGSSQAVRLPAEFRFNGEQIYATRDEITGDVVLSERPGAKAWREFFEMTRSMSAPEDLMRDRPMNVPPRERDVFAEQR